MKEKRFVKLIKELGDWLTEWFIHAQLKPLDSVKIWHKDSFYELYYPLV